MLAIPHVFVSPLLIMLAYTRGNVPLRLQIIHLCLSETGLLKEFSRHFSTHRLYFVAETINPIHLQLNFLSSI